MTPLQSFATWESSLPSLPFVQSNTTLGTIGAPLQAAMADCLTSLSPDPIPLFFKTCLLAYAYSLHCKMDHQTALPRQFFLGLAAIHTIHTGLFSSGPSFSASSTMLKVAAAALVINFNQNRAS